MTDERKVRACFKKARAARDEANKLEAMLKHHFRKDYEEKYPGRSVSCDVTTWGVRVIVWGWGQGSPNTTIDVDLRYAQP